MTETSKVIIHVSGFKSMSSSKRKKAEHLLSGLSKYFEESGVPNEIFIDLGKEYIVRKKHQTAQPRY